MRIAIETGTHSPWVSRLLEECGHEVLVANSRKLRLIYANRRKTDEVDAENLARLARVDPKLLYPLKHRGEESQAHMAIIRSRQALVDCRTQLVDHVPRRSGPPVDWKMLVMRTTENPAYSICKLISAKQSLGLYHLAFAVNPLRLYSVQPRTLFWQKAAYDPHPGFASTVFDLPVVLAEPAGLL